MTRVTFYTVASAFLLLATSAQAGFEWVPPQQPAVSPQLQAAPANNANLTPLPGEVVKTTTVTTQSVQSAPVPVIPTPAPPVPAVAAAPVPPPPVPAETIAWTAPPVQAPAPVAAPAPLMPTPLAMPTPAPIMAEAPVAPAEPRASVEDPLFKPAVSAPRELVPVKPKTDIVEGFGRDVPLTVATQQIVPSEYSVQYGPNVDPSSAVTWKGGKSWKVALQDALKERDLKATIVADSVLIENTAPPSPVIAAVPAPAPEPIAIAPLIPVTPVPAPTVLVAAEEPQGLAPVNEVIVETRPGETMPLATTTTKTTTTTASNGVYDMGAPAVAQAPAAAVAPVAYIPPVMPSPTATQVWVAPRASTLRQVLSDWSQQAGVQLQWSAQYDYPLMSDVQIGGSFEDAVETLLSGLVDAQPRPVARLHPNEPNGPAILVVETRHIME